MAKSHHSLTIFFIFIVATTGNKHGYKKEKLSHFHLYWHDVASGKNPTSAKIVTVPSRNNSAAPFGTVFMNDNTLTEGSELSSKFIGRGQGLLASAAQNEIGLLMVMNFAFETGKYNGSTISILGRNTIFSKVREMPIVGGSELFRFARGYVQARTYKFDLLSGDATVEYDIYVMHF
ncbi:hypothetical protein GIB67_016878 [Kingdonia uniflora]|uniref:Dirigent protein n=1 Tax=Kingdonia uniflora TaxID=39325 RepID=A0A7J7M3D4_9MAGN|nr:hypothetical protein GIB67_016878 [Kingdonia uniflora]